MAPPEHRRIDYLFFGYFLFQIPSTLFMETQGVYPEWLYPSFMKGVKDHYLESYRDPFLASPLSHPWYLSICLVEHFLEVPFFFWATFCFYHGALKRPSIIMPSILYSVHTMTAVLSVWFMALFSDFSQTVEVMAPRNLAERLKLCSAYSPFFFISLVLLLDGVRLTSKQKND